MDESVSDRVGVGRIPDQLVPVLDRHLAGYDGRAPLVQVSLLEAATRGSAKAPGPVLKNQT